MKRKLQLTDSQEVADLMEQLSQNINNDTDDDEEEEKEEEDDDAVAEKKGSKDGRRKFYIAGVDISFVKGDDVNACAALVVLNFPKLQVCMGRVLRS